MKCFVTYTTENLEMAVDSEKSLLELCLKHEVPIDHICEGGASCGTCRVIVVDDPQKLPKRNSLEQEMANDRKFSPEERLACQLNPNINFCFRLPKDKF